ncbi:MAG: hypothetical protein WEA28_07880 [Xanthobacteraceae bacterium]
MSRRKAARFLVRFVILGTAAGALAGYSAHAMRPGPARPADAAAGSAAAAPAPQTSNKTAKADRLPAPGKAAATSGDSVTYSLASLSPRTDFDRIGNETIAATPAIPYAEQTRETAAPVAPAAAPDRPAIAAAPLPRERPKRLPPPAPQASGLLDDTHIAGIKTRLQLTSDQAEYWPAVEAALREIAKSQFREQHIKHVRAGKAKIDVNAPEVQKLIWAAMPLLALLREDQKREVRKLARVIGLDSVAAQI